MAQTLGIIDLVWLGRQMPVEKGATLKLGGAKNNVVIAGRRVFRAAEWTAAEIEATTVLQKGDRYTDLYSTGVEGEMQVVCDTGQVFVFPDAFLEELPKMTGGEGGKVGLKWFAGDHEELANG